MKIYNESSELVCEGEDAVRFVRNVRIIIPILIIMDSVKSAVKRLVMAMILSVRVISKEE